MKIREITYAIGGQVYLGKEAVIERDWSRRNYRGLSCSREGSFDIERRRPFAAETGEELHA